MTLELYLDRLKQNIFNTPYASEGKDSRGIFAPARRVTKKYGLTMRTIQFNGPRCIRYLIFDIDRPLGALAWEDANLPIPNLIIRNPQNGHAHLVYEIAEAVWKRRNDDERPGEALPVRYYKSTYRAMQKALGADPSYNGLLAKNPFHPDWVVICGRLEPYTLAQLTRHLELNAEPSSEIHQHPDGRNCTLFDSIRQWAYRAKRHYRDLQSFRSNVYAHLDYLNAQLAQPLSQSELKSIGKSVSTWVWVHYTGSGGKQRGLCQLDDSMSLPEKQRVGQAKSAEQKCLDTQTRLKIAIEILARKGVRLTKTAIAAQAGLNRSTLYRHWQSIQHHYVEFNSLAGLSDDRPAGSETLGSNTDREAVSLRDVSSVPPAGAGGPVAREGYPDGHLKRQIIKQALLDRLRGSTLLLSTPPEKVPKPDRTSVLGVQRIIDRYYERTPRRFN